MAQEFLYCPLSRALRKAKFARTAWHARIDQMVLQLERVRLSLGDEGYKYSSTYRHATKLLQEVTGAVWDKEAEKLGKPGAKPVALAPEPKEDQFVDKRTPEQIAADKERGARLVPDEVEGTVGTWDPNADTSGAVAGIRKNRLM